MEEECPWEIYFSKNESRSFQIKTYQKDHTYCRVSKINTTNRKWVV